MRKSDEMASAKTAVNKVNFLAKMQANSKTIAEFMSLLLIAVIAPIFGVQAITGTLVNATLFLATVLLGTETAVLIGIIPSIVSLATGLIALAVAPMVPFIVLSNAILVVIFSLLRKKSYWTGVAAASVLKFVFLSGVSSFIIGNFVSAAIAFKIALMASDMQLFTAVSGGILAYIILLASGKMRQ